MDAVVGSDVNAMCWDSWILCGFSPHLVRPSVKKYNTGLSKFAVRTILESALPDQNVHAVGAQRKPTHPGVHRDKLVKGWNVLDEEDGGKRNLSLVMIGVVRNSTYFFPVDVNTVQARSSSQYARRSWDVAASFEARKAFGAKLREVGRVLREKEEGNSGGLVSVVSDDEESGGEDDDE
ncbi:hypothetical protein K438DRAFT_1963215 [Mycena galopus ATCC 62051]|nr:hypothetical protein K438DRAFT_1963215 [Mycena galopus ATCC 62051]